MMLDQTLPRTAICAPLADQFDVQRVVAEGWPKHLPRSTYDLIAASARRFGDAPALSFFLEADRHQSPAVWGFSDYLKEVTRAANLFGQLGVAAGDVVALILPNLPETYFCLWGSEAAGVALPINPLLEAGGMAELLRASRAKVVVTVQPFPGVDLFDKVVEAVATAPDVEHVVTIGMAHHVRGWKRWPATIKQAQLMQAAPPLRTGIKRTDYRKAVAGLNGAALDSGRVIESGDLASMFGTGGTTGAPKLAQRTHGNEVANAFMSTRTLGDALPAGGVVFAGLPLFHVNGAMVTGLAPLFNGGHILLGSPQGYRGRGMIERFWEIVAHHEVGTFSGVPTLFSSLLRVPTAGHDLSSLKFAICGSAPMAPELIAQFERTTGVKILEGYGMTEATCVVSLNPLPGVCKAGSVGLPAPFQEVRIFKTDGDTISPADTGETGAVALRGPNIFQGYLSEHHNQGVWLTDTNGEVWLNTGDLGDLDDDGYLWLRGRAKDIIIRGGHNIDPAVIEDAFFAHPSVALAAAIGRRDAHAGEVPVVYVELKPGEAVSETALIEFANQRIMERAARPKAVRIVPAMPLTAIGKVFKPALREIEERWPRNN